MDDKSEKYFNNISSRERAIFEGAITMGALFHQFVGTPINLDNVLSLENAIKEAMELQPCIAEVDVKINQEMIREALGAFEYTSLTGEMLEVRITSVFKDKRAVTCIRYIEELNYPLMYIEDIN
jgi:hypothetical protein